MGVIDLTDDGDDPGEAPVVVDEAAKKRHKNCGAIAFVVTEIFKAIRTRVSSQSARNAIHASTTLYFALRFRYNDPCLLCAYMAPTNKTICTSSIIAAKAIRGAPVPSGHHKHLYRHLQRLDRAYQHF